MAGGHGWLHVFVAGAALLLLVPAGLAQTGSSEDRPESPGFLYLTGEQVGSGTFFPACHGPGEIPAYGLTTEVPRETEGSKVHTGGEYGATSCRAFFEYEVKQAFNVPAHPRVLFWLGCDVGAAMASSSDVGDQTTDFRAELFVNLEEIGQGGGDYPSGLYNLCLPEFDPMRLETQFFDADRTAVVPGDTITLTMSFFGTVSPDDNLYIAANSAQTPSALYGPGLPGKLRSSPHSALVADVGNSSSSAGPGNATTYAFTVENLGNESQQVSVSVEGPNGWLTEPSPAALTLAPGETAGGNLTVAATQSLAPGVEGEHVWTLSSGDDAVSFQTTTTVVPGNGTPAQEVMDDHPLDAASTEGDDDSLSLGGIVQDFGIEIAATAVAGTVAFVARLYA